MALTITEKVPAILNFGLKVYFLNVTFDNSYPTGGESFAESDINTAVTDDCDKILFVVPNLTDTGVVPRFNPSTKKLELYWVDTTTDGAPLAEVTAATDASTYDAEVLVIAK